MRLYEVSGAPDDGGLEIEAIFGRGQSIRWEILFRSWNFRGNDLIAEETPQHSNLPLPLTGDGGPAFYQGKVLDLGGVLHPHGHGTLHYGPGLNTFRFEGGWHRSCRDGRGDLQVLRPFAAPETNADALEAVDHDKQRDRRYAFFQVKGAVWKCDLLQVEVPPQRRRELVRKPSNSVGHSAHQRALWSTRPPQLLYFHDAPIGNATFNEILHAHDRYEGSFDTHFRPDGAPGSMLYGCNTPAVRERREELKREFFTAMEIPPNCSTQYVGGWRHGERHGGECMTVDYFRKPAVERFARCVDGKLQDWMTPRRFDDEFYTCDDEQETQTQTRRGTNAQVSRPELARTPVRNQSRIIRNKTMHELPTH